MLLESEAFSKLVQEKMEEMKVPGLSIAVVDGDDIHVKNYGQAQIDGKACTTDTLFDCASTSKSFTAAAVALLVNDEKYPDVNWTTPVSQILGDDFVLADPMYTANVTIEDILSHRSGIPAHEQSFLGAQSAAQDTAKSVTRNLRNLPIIKPLRTEFQYNNMLYTVATHLVETVTGESYPSFIKSRLWEPLGMTNTYHDVPGIAAASALDRLATGYRWDIPSARNVGVPAYAQPEAQGAGLIYSAPADWAKWVRAMARRAGPLSAASHAALVTPRTIILDEDDVLPFSSQRLYALGWYVESYRGHALVGHGGSFTGFASLMWFLPGRDWGVVVFGNADSAFYVNEIVLCLLLDEKLGVPVDERVDWEAFWGDMYRRDRAEEEKGLEELAGLEVKNGDVAVEKLVGTYRNAGYHSLKLELCEGVLRADGSDRCMPIELTFFPSGGKKMDVKMHWTVDGASKKTNGEFTVDEQGEVTAVGVGFMDEMDDYLIWFDRVA